MQDLNVNIGGPSGKATQTIHFNVRYAGAGKRRLDASEVVNLVENLRGALRTVELSEDKSRRAERSLVGIEEETTSGTPDLKEIENSLGSIGRIIESVGQAAPTVVSIFKGLAAALGFVV